MMRLLRTLLELTAALALFAAMFLCAFYFARTTPTIAPGWFFGIAVFLYTMIVLLFLHRNGAAQAPRRRRAE